MVRRLVGSGVCISDRFNDSGSDSEWQADFEVVLGGFVFSCVVVMCQTKCGSLGGGAGFERWP